MTIGSLSAQIDLILSGRGIDRCVGIAAFNDLLRGPHETFVKSHYDEVNLLCQVKMALGGKAAYHLARLINCKSGFSKDSRIAEGCFFVWTVKTICRERGLSHEDGTTAFGAFLQSLDEERFAPSGNVESSTRVMVYFALDAEASYHLGGLYNKGDDAMLVGIELQYLDSRLKRFRTTVERWEMERQWIEEDSR